MPVFPRCRALLGRCLLHLVGPPQPCRLSCQGAALSPAHALLWRHHPSPFRTVLVTLLSVVGEFCPPCCVLLFQRGPKVGLLGCKCSTASMILGLIAFPSPLHGPWVLPPGGVSQDPADPPWGFGGGAPDSWAHLWTACGQLCPRC